MNMAEPQYSRHLKVGVFGNSFWAGRLADSLAGCPLDVQCLYTDQDRTLKGRSVRHWLAESALWSFDVLHVLGWPRLWNLWVAARLKRTSTILHWLGSDVSSFRTSPRWSRVAGPALNLLVTRHLAQSPWLAEELREVGVHAQVATHPNESLDNVMVPPLPASPRVLAMLRPNKFEFYGGAEVLKMARAAPDIRWLIVVHDGTGLPYLPNVEYLGHVEDMDDVYRRTTVLVRLTRHDGMSNTVLESLARGRHVIWSYPMPCCRRASTAAEALPLVREAIASGALNLEGAAYVRKEFDDRKLAQRLTTLYATIARRRAGWRCENPACGGYRGHRL